MKRNRFAIVATALIMAITTFGCSSASTAGSPATTGNDSASPASAAAPSGEKKEYVIGVAMKTLQDQFPKDIADAIQKKAASMGNVKIVLTDGQADIATQMSQVENLIAQKVDAIILNPQDANGLGSAVDECKKAGIPVVECNTETDNKNYDSYVGSSDVEAGKIQGEFVKNAIGGKGEVAIMYGVMGQSGQIGRKEGVKESLLDTSPEVKLVADQTAEWQRDKALKLAEDWILRFPNLKAIMAQNDDMALGAVQAVENAGKQKDIIVVGVDAIEGALTAVKDGKLACTVFQDAEGQGTGALDAAIALANGEKVQKNVLIPFKLVTKDNVSDFIK